MKLVVCDRQHDIFSIGAARDIGVQHASAPVVMFNDIDFLGTPQMYRRVAGEVRGRKMRTNAYEFFCVPVMWLTEQASSEYLELYRAGDDDVADYTYHAAYEEHDKSKVETVAYGSSAMVVNRHHYLAIGGHDKQFFGHGAEDYDVLHRLAKSFPRGPRTRNYKVNTKNNSIGEYEGYRAFFATYGIDVLQRGIYFVHLWHPTRTMAGYKQTQRNFQILDALMQEFDRVGKQPFPLENLTQPEKTLLLVDPTSKVANSLRHAIPAMGEVKTLPEKLFADSQSVLDYVSTENITRVGLLNPYGNEHRLAIYRALRKNKVPYWTFDRGALPDSWFFDPNGFNADSVTYDRAKWDVELTESEELDAIELIRTLRQSDMTLETNGPRMTAAHWRERLNLRDRKVIFVPMQRPNDSVIKYFSGPCQNMDTFVSWITSLANSLDPRRWALVVKKHPLEDDMATVPGAIIAPHDCNVHDLIELADKIVLVNSGVGVLGAAFGKPVIHCGEAFYAAVGMNWAAKSEAQLLELATRDLQVQQQLPLRFLYHLAKRVYSYGSPSYDRSTDSSGKPISIVKEIIFRELRGLTEEPIVLGEPRRGLSLDAPLFYSFGGRKGILTPASSTSHAAASALPPPSSSSQLLIPVPSPPPKALKIGSGELMIAGNGEWAKTNKHLIHVGSWPLVLLAAHEKRIVASHVKVSILVRGSDSKAIQEAHFLQRGKLVQHVVTALRPDVFLLECEVLPGEKFTLEYSSTRNQAPLSEVEIIGLAAQSATPSQPIKIEELIPKKKIRTTLFIDGELKNNSEANLLIFIDNAESGFVTDTEGYSLQLRWKGPDGVTRKAAALKLPGKLSPGRNILMAQQKVSLPKPEEISFAYVDLMSKAAGACFTGRDQKLQIS
ncbi:capsule polysaccharide biosynthesis protein [Acetobacteraceae bacterium AT-5844]|nr:capsule polysaccharide biosynthesis protein [Acetobacteraceae bacterium AT-5844]